MKSYISHFESRLGAMTWRISTLVESETPTSEKVEVDRVVNALAEWAAGLGAQVRLHQQAIVGDCLECRWNTQAPGAPILIICHLDTVHPLGSVERSPTRIEDDVLFGLGAYDMKASIVLVQTVLEDLQALGLALARPVIWLVTTDEEIGSPYSRPLVEKLGREAELVLVMEFSDYEERIVTARKGVGIFQLTVLGRESHSGSAPGEGINALVEAARLVEPVVALSDPARARSLRQRLCAAARVITSSLASVTW
ncbi:MAG: M20 family metallopeptidase [Anaerolineae bacterium]|nr:M20 family metallopeptidase [Anaerolineae bacterium]